MFSAEDLFYLEKPDPRMGPSQLKYIYSEKLAKANLFKLMSKNLGPFRIIKFPPDTIVIEEDGDRNLVTIISPYVQHI